MFFIRDIFSLQTHLCAIMCRLLLPTNIVKGRLSLGHMNPLSDSTVLNFILLLLVTTHNIRTSPQSTPQTPAPPQLPPP